LQETLISKFNLLSNSCGLS